MTTAKKLMTADEFADLPNDRRHYELVKGKLVETAPLGEEHGTIMSNVVFEVSSFVRPRNLGRTVAGDPGYILERGPDTVRGPDFAFTTRERLQAGPEVGFTSMIPDIVAEIVSPSNRPCDVERKTREWRAAGVRLVLMFYPATRTVVAHRGPDDVHRYTDADILDAEPVLPGFACPVARFFEQ